MSRKQTLVAGYFALSFVAVISTAHAGAASENAEAALAQAEVSVASARARGALWTTAQTALREARAARNRGDFDTAMRLSTEARTLAELGIAQKGSQP